jgi:hypothetical protein
MSSKKNNNFKRDYRDICYFIDHVKDIDFRVDLIKSLGYKIGVNIVKGDDDKEKSITIGKRKEYRIQIVPTSRKSPLVKCAIVEY